MIRIHRIPPPECESCRGYGEHISGTDPVGEGRPCTNGDCVDGVDALCAWCRAWCCAGNDDWWRVECGGDEWLCGSWECVAELITGELIPWVKEIAA